VNNKRVGNEISEGEKSLWARRAFDTTGVGDRIMYDRQKKKR
jgi:hypothetical protein